MHFYVIKCFSVEMFIRFLLLILISETEWVNTFAFVKATPLKQDWENITKPEASSLYWNFSSPSNADNFSARENGKNGIVTLRSLDKYSRISQTNQSDAQKENKLSAVPNGNSSLLRNSNLKPVFEKYKNSSTDLVKRSKYLEDSHNGLDSQMIELSSVVEGIQTSTEYYDKYGKSEEEVSNVDPKVDIEPLVVIDVSDTNRNKSINGTYILDQRRSLGQLPFNDSKEDRFLEFEKAEPRNRRNVQSKPEWISRNNLYANNKDMYGYQNKNGKDSLLQKGRVLNMELNPLLYQNSYADAYDDNQILDSDIRVPVKDFKDRSSFISKDRPTEFDDKTKVLENKNIAVNKQTYYINKNSLKQLNESINVNEKIIPYKTGTSSSNINMSQDLNYNPLSELQVLKMKLSNSSIKDKKKNPYGKMNSSKANLGKYAERMNIKPAPTGFVEFLRPEMFETSTDKKKPTVYNRKRINNRDNKMYRVINATGSNGSSKKRHLQNDKENRPAFDANYISRNEEMPISDPKRNDYFRQMQRKLTPDNLPQNKISVKKIYNQEGIEPGLQIDIPPPENLIDIMVTDGPFNQYAGKAFAANIDQAVHPQFKDYQSKAASKNSMLHGDRQSENRNVAKEIKTINKITETENIQIEKQVPLSIRESSTYGDLLSQNDPYNFRLIPLQNDFRNNRFNQANFPKVENGYQMQKQIPLHRREKSAYDDLLMEKDPYNFRLVPMKNDFRYNWYNQANIAKPTYQTQKRISQNRGQVSAYGGTSMSKDPYRLLPYEQMVTEYDFRNQINRYQTPDTYADLYYNYRKKRLLSDENNFLNVRKGNDSRPTTSAIEHTETDLADASVTFDYTNESSNVENKEDIDNETLPMPLQKVDKKSKKASSHKIEKQKPLNRKEKSSYDNLLMENDPYNFGLYQLNNDFTNGRYHQANFPKVQNTYQIEKQFPQNTGENFAYGNLMMQNDPYNFRGKPYEQMVNKFDFPKQINNYQTPDTYADLYYNYRNKRSELKQKNILNIKNKKDSSMITSAYENLETDLLNDHVTFDYSNLSPVEGEKSAISTRDHYATETSLDNKHDYGQGSNIDQQHSTDMYFYKTSTEKDSNLSTNKVRKLLSFSEEKDDLDKRKRKKSNLKSRKIPKRAEKSHNLEKHMPLNRSKKSSYSDQLMQNDPYNFGLYPLNNYYRGGMYVQANYPKAPNPYHIVKQPYDQKVNEFDFQQPINRYQTPDTYADLYYNYRRKRVPPGKENSLKFKNRKDSTFITSATENMETTPLNAIDSNFSKSRLAELNLFTEDKDNTDSTESNKDMSNENKFKKTEKPRQLNVTTLQNRGKKSPYGNLLMDNNPYNFGLYELNNDFRNDRFSQANYPNSQNNYQIQKQIPQYAGDSSVYGDALMPNDRYNFRLNPYEQMVTKFNFQNPINSYQTPDTYADLYYNYRNKRSDLDEKNFSNIKSKKDSSIITSPYETGESDLSDVHVTFDNSKLNIVDDDKNVISTSDDFKTETTLENNEQYYNTDMDFYKTSTEKDSNVSPNKLRKLLFFTEENGDLDTKNRSKNILKHTKNTKKAEKQNKLEKHIRLNRRKKSPYGNLLMQNDPYNFGLYPLNNYYSNDRYGQANFPKSQNPYQYEKQIPQYRTETSKAPVNWYQTPDTYADLYYNYRKKRLPLRHANTLNFENGKDSNTITSTYEDIETNPSDSTDSNFNKGKDQEHLSFMEGKGDLDSTETTKNIINNKQISMKTEEPHLLKKLAPINRREKSPYGNLLMDNNPYNFGLYEINNDARNDRYSQVNYPKPQNTYQNDKQIPQYRKESSAFGDVLMSNDPYNFRLIPQYRKESSAYGDVLMSNDPYNFRSNPYEQIVNKFDFQKPINMYQTPDTYADLYYNYRNKRSDLGRENNLDMKKEKESSIITSNYDNVETDPGVTFDYSNLSIADGNRNVISTTDQFTAERSLENTLDYEQGFNNEQHYNSDMDDFEISTINDSNFSKGKVRKLFSFKEEDGNLDSGNRNNKLKDTKIYKRAENPQKKEKLIILNRRKKSPYGQLMQNDPYNFGLYPLNNYYRGMYGQANFPKAQNPYQIVKQPYEQKTNEFDFQKPIDYQTPDTYADLYYNYRNKRLSLGQENPLNFKNAKDSTTINSAYENIERDPSTANDSKLNRGKDQELHSITEEKGDLDATERTKNIINGKRTSNKTLKTLQLRKETPLKRREKSSYGNLLMDNDPYNFGLYRMNNDFTNDRYSYANYPKAQSTYQIEKQIPQYRGESSAYGDVLMPNDPYNKFRINPYEQMVTKFDFQKPINMYQTPDTYADLYYNYRSKRSDLVQTKFLNTKNEKDSSINTLAYENIETDVPVKFDNSNLNVDDDERNTISTSDSFATETSIENALDNSEGLNNEQHYNSGKDFSKNSTAKDSNLSMNKVRKLLLFTEEKDDLDNKKRNNNISEHAKILKKGEKHHMLKKQLHLNKRKKSPYGDQLMQNDPYNFGLYPLNNYYRNHRYGQANFPKAQNPYQIEKELPQYKTETSTYGDILMPNDPYNFRLYPYEQKANEFDFQKPVNRYQTPDTYADLYYNYRNKRLPLDQETSMNLKDREEFTIITSAYENMETDPSDSNDSNLSKNKHQELYSFPEKKGDLDSMESTNNIFNDNKIIKKVENPHQLKKLTPQNREEKSPYDNLLMDNSPYNFGLYPVNNDFRNDWYNQANYPKSQNPYQIPQYRGESFAQGGNLMSNDAYNVRLNPYQQIVTKSDIQKQVHQTPDTYADLYYNFRNRRSLLEQENLSVFKNEKDSSTTTVNYENTQNDLPDAQVKFDNSILDNADRGKNIKDVHEKTQTQPFQGLSNISEKEIEILPTKTADVARDVMNDFNRRESFITDNKEPKIKLVDKHNKIRNTKEPSSFSSNNLN